MKISNLLESFEFELSRKNYRQQSIINYVSCVTKFLYHFKDKDSAQHINEDDIKKFLYSFKEANTQRGIILQSNLFINMYVTSQINLDGLNMQNETGNCQ